MTSLLRQSLDTIREEADGIACCSVANKLARVVELLQAKACARPTFWGLYSDLCKAIALDDITAANAAAAALDQTLGAVPAPYVANLHDDDLGEGCAAVYGRALDDDSTRPLGLVAVDAGEAERGRTLIAEARDLIGETSPDLLSEMDALVREIVLVKSRPEAYGFKGAATLFLWGAIFINPLTIQDRLAMAEALTHEAGHALLTGLTGGRDVTVNDRKERFASPLRKDPRPMEGVAHATFVLARMNMMLDQLAGSQRLVEDERTRLASMRASNASHFDKAMLTLKEHALFTPEGAAIFASCETFMCVDNAENDVVTVAT